MKKLLTIGVVLLAMITSTFAENAENQARLEQEQAENQARLEQEQAENQARLAQEHADNLLKSTNMISLKFEGENQTSIGYCQGVFGEELAGDYALVLFLHGAGERGDLSGRQLTHGVPEITTYIKENNIKAVVIAPQCPNEQQWADTPWADVDHTMSEEPSAAMSLAMQLLNSKIAEFSVDKSRIYVTGISMGGYGTWDIISRNPKLFAGAIPICGGGDVKQMVKLKDMPILIFHGDIDTIVPTENSQKLNQALLEAGSTKAKYTEYENCEHNSWYPAYNDPATIKWLFEQQLP